MKKIASVFLCLNLLIFNQAIVCAELFHDALIDKLDKTLKVEKTKQTTIQDDFAYKTLNSNLKVNKIEKSLIIDDFALRTLNSDLQIKKVSNPIQVDNLAKKLDKNITTDKKVENTKVYNTSFETIKISPIKNYTTKNSLLGDKLDFVLMNDVKINNVLYKKGHQISAKVENISQNGAYGVPSDVVIGNFTIEKQVLDGNITKQGANRSIWVYPTAYILLPFFGVGLFILPIRGGHAKLCSNKVYEIDI